MLAFLRIIILTNLALTLKGGSLVCKSILRRVRSCLLRDRIWSCQRILQMKLLRMMLDSKLLSFWEIRKILKVLSLTIWICIIPKAELQAIILGWAAIKMAKAEQRAEICRRRAKPLWSTLKIGLWCMNNRYKSILKTTRRSKGSMILMLNWALRMTVVSWLIFIT